MGRSGSAHGDRARQSEHREQLTHPGELCDAQRELEELAFAEVLEDARHEGPVDAGVIDTESLGESQAGLLTRSESRIVETATEHGVDIVVVDHRHAGGVAEATAETEHAPVAG